MGPFQTNSPLLVVLVVSVGVAGCSLFGKDQGPNDGGAKSSVTVDCEEGGYPCTFAEVDRSTLKRTDELMEGARQQLADGQEFPAVAEWLRSQDGVASAEADWPGLIFRVEGGRPALLYDGYGAWTEGARPDDDDPMDQGLTSKLTSTEVRRGALDESLSQLVVGKDRDGDGQRDFEKRALILEPFASQKNDWLVELEGGDLVAGDEVAAILEGTPDYEGRVDYLEDDEVALDQFANWDEYDLVVISTHGYHHVSNTNGATASIILSPVEVPSCEGFADRTEMTRQAGLFCASINITGSWGSNTYLGFVPSYFEKNYGSGLDDTFVFLAACQSATLDQKEGRGSILAQTVLGDRSLMFGWTNNVRAAFSADAQRSLFQWMGEEGLSAHESLERLCEAGRCAGDVPSGASTRLVSFPTDASFDLRVRDMVRLIDPETGESVESGEDLVNLIDGTIGDDETEEITYAAELHGLQEDPALDPEDLDPTSGEQPAYTLRVFVDGESARAAIPILETEKTGENSWRVPAETIPLDRAIADGETLRFELRADLPYTIDGANTRTGQTRTPALEHTFEACSVEATVFGDNGGTFSGPEAYYDPEANTLSLTAYRGGDVGAESVQVTARMNDSGTLTSVGMSGAVNESWSQSDDTTSTITLSESDDRVTGSLSATFPGDTPFVTLDATFDANVTTDQTCIR